MRSWPVVLVLTMLLAGCEANNASRPAPASPSLSGITIPLTTADTWRRMQQTLQSPVDAYSAAWRQALHGRIPFDGSVGVAVLAEGDASSSFCASPPFDVKGKALTYCDAAHSGPDSLPWSVIILVPYDFYNATLPDVSTSDGQIVGRQGTAILLARVYAEYLTTQLKQLGISGLKPDCVAGLTLRSFIPELSSDVRPLVAFVDKFTIAVCPRLT